MGMCTSWARGIASGSSQFIAIHSQKARVELVRADPVSMLQNRLGLAEVKRLRMKRTAATGLLLLLVA